MLSGNMSQQQWIWFSQLKVGAIKKSLPLTVRVCLLLLGARGTRSVPTGETIGETSMCGILFDREGDTDVGQTGEPGKSFNYMCTQFNKKFLLLCPCFSRDSWNTGWRRDSRCGVCRVCGVSGGPQHECAQTPTTSSNQEPVKESTVCCNLEAF